MKTAKQIPIPARTHPNAKWSIIMKSLNIDESFLVKTASEAVCVRVAAKRLGMNVAQRKEGNKIRVWRTE